MYQIQYRYYGGSWVRDATRYEHWSDAMADVETFKEYNKKIDKIEVVKIED